ncbi:snake venom vascular endothelial growth factor toxin-like [Rhynchophorus ferrugineus]|uniref:Platelet-derived growth factor (PDGF) family profile domain-containing protein n=1 Tax=Rhynchophorus ferrugineus TaxID=354439 RepID=A0A834I4H1_RHYFE|nr:hypothetical protein GWI33_019860 [Rhynchophorus ferrugineus]
MHFVACLVITVSVVSLVASRYLNYEEVNEISDAFPCHIPQPRAIEVEEIVGNKAFVYYPAYVVLHRCGNSGCCPDGTETCGPEHVDSVKLTVSYVDGYSMDKMVIEATNHTSCICVPKNANIK